MFWPCEVQNQINPSHSGTITFTITFHVSPIQRWISDVKLGRPAQRPHRFIMSNMMFSKIQTFDIFNICRIYIWGYFVFFGGASVWFLNARHSMCLGVCIWLINSFCLSSSFNMHGFKFVWHCRSTTVWSCLFDLICTIYTGECIIYLSISEHKGFAKRHERGLQSFSTKRYFAAEELRKSSKLSTGVNFTVRR